MVNDLQPLALIPGINTEDSPLAAKGQYIAGNNVRFWKSRPQKVGGSTPYIGQGLIGPARGKVTWRALDGTRLAAYGTAYGLFLIFDETVYDITPLERDDLIVNPFAYTQGSNVVTVFDNAHGKKEMDRVIIISELNAGGTPQGDLIEGSYFIQTIVDADHYTIELPNPVPFINGVNYGTGQYEITAYGGGAQTVYFRYPIASGRVVGSPGGGYGTGYYGGGGYGGDVGLFSVADSARIWSLDHWGENLVACYYGSTIYQWSFEDGPLYPAYPLPGAPAEVGALFVSEDDRILVALGSTDTNGVFDPKLVRWSDQENNEVWTAAETNYAGDKRAEKGTKLVGSIETVSGRLILTDTAAYSFRFIGQPFVYSLTFVDGNCGLAAPHGIGKIDDIAYWIGTTGFYLYDGTIRRVPCSLQEQLFGDSDTPGEISVAQMDLVHAGENKRFRELMFHYPTEDFGDVSKVAALQIEGDSALWWTGDQARTTWIDDDQFLAYPVGTDIDGKILIQEFGLNNSSLPLPYSLTTSDIDIAEGSVLMQISRLVPDFKRISGNHKLEIIARDYPMGDDAGEILGTEIIPFDRLSTDLEPRLQGRTISLRFFSDELSTEFRLGHVRIATFPRGRRG